jgi:hypothetical protein
MSTAVKNVGKQLDANQTLTSGPENFHTNEVDRTEYGLQRPTDHTHDDPERHHKLDRMLMLLTLGVGVGAFMLLTCVVDYNPQRFEGAAKDAADLVPRGYYMGEFFNGAASTVDPDLLWAQNRDLAFIVFIGFPLMYCFLKKCAFTAIGYGLFTGTFAITQSLLWQPLIALNTQSDFWTVSQTNLGLALMATAGLMVAYGPVIGKQTPFAAVFTAAFFMLVHSFNYWISVYEIKGVDASQSILTLGFGAFFGMGLTYFITSKGAATAEHLQNSTSSDKISLIGLLFLFVLAPSFNSCQMVWAGGNLTTTVLNTVFSQVGAVAAYFMLSYFLTGEKFNIAYMGHASLAGFVTIGTIGHMPMTCTGAMLIGFLGGTCCTLSHIHLHAKFLKVFAFHDVASIHCSFGVGAVVSAIVSCIWLPVTSDNTTLSGMFLNEAKSNTGPFFANTICADSTRVGGFCDVGELIGRQLAILGVAIGLGLVGGAACGAFLNILHLPTPEGALFDDSYQWEMIIDDLTGKKSGKMHHHDEVEDNGNTAHHDFASHLEKADDQV